MPIMAMTTKSSTSVNPLRPADGDVMTQPFRDNGSRWHAIAMPNIMVDGATGACQGDADRRVACSRARGDKGVAGEAVVRYNLGVPLP